MNYENESGEIFLMINILAEINPFLKEEGLSHSGGIIVFTETSAAKNQFLSQMKAAGGVEVKTTKSRSDDDIPNNCFAIYTYKRYDKDVDVLAFLDQEEFFPIVLIYSVIPDVLQMRENIWVFKALKDEVMAQVLKELQAFKRYIRENPLIFQREMRLIRSSNVLQDTQRGNSLILGLIAAAQAYAIFYRERHDENETALKVNTLRNVINDFAEISESYIGKFDILPSVKWAVERYVENTEDLRIGNIYEVERELLEAVQNDNAILYDSEWYYIPQTVFKDICKKNLELVSDIVIKEELYKAGMLSCNELQKTNFTVKKIFFTSYGECLRKRFLKISKEFFITEDTLALEELGRRQEECTLDVLTEDLA